MRKPKCDFSKVKEVRRNYNCKAGHPIYDFMINLGDGQSHCSTCSCNGYVTHNGFSLYTTNKSVYSQWTDLSTEQRIEYARKHPEHVIDSNTVTPEHY